MGRAASGALGEPPRRVCVGCDSILGASRGTRPPQARAEMSASLSAVRAREAPFWQARAEFFCDLNTSDADGVANLMRLALVALALAGAAAHILRRHAAARSVARICGGAVFSVARPAAVEPPSRCLVRRARRRGGRPDAAVGCYYPTRDDSVYFDCEATTEGKLRVCYCDDGLPQWLKQGRTTTSRGTRSTSLRSCAFSGAAAREGALGGLARSARRRRADR